MNGLVVSPGSSASRKARSQGSSLHSSFSRLEHLETECEEINSSILLLKDVDLTF